MEHPANKLCINDTLVYRPEGTSYYKWGVYIDKHPSRYVKRYPSNGDKVCITGLRWNVHKDVLYVDVRFISGNCCGEQASGFLVWLNTPSIPSITFPFGILDQSSIDEPKNNDGRSECFWCKSKTKQVRSIVSVYNICTKCGR